jgi:uncharacterized membrane protein
MEPKQQRFSIWYFVLALVVLMALQSVLFAPHTENVTYNEFKALVTRGKVTDLVLDRQTITGTLASEGLEGVLPKDKIEELKRYGKGMHRFVTALFFGEALSRGRVLGLLLGLSGVGLVLSGDGEGLVTVKGVAFSLMAAGGIAAGNLVMKHIGRRVDGLTATAWQYVLGGLPLLGWALAVEDPAEVAWTRTFVAGLVFLGVVGSAGTSWLWYHLLRDGALIPLNGLTLLIPVFALGLALLIYRERLSAPGLAGVAATAAGVMWVSWPRAVAVEAPSRRLGAR